MRATALVAAGLLLVGCTAAADPATTTVTLTQATVTTTTAITTTTVASGGSSTLLPTATTTTDGPGESLAGWDTWALIYASLETGSHERAEAAAIAATIEGAGVLRSNDYPSLNPGYWVVYGGEWGSRRAAGAWCPPELDPSLTCYPRYLGPDIAQLLTAGGAIAQIEGRLVVLDPATGEIEATFSDSFHYEAEFPAQFNLSAGGDELYFGLGWEDSWYSCESDRGEIRRLDLDSGVEDVFADGWWPAISPDRRWLALVAAGECYPDPEVDGWVITPGSQVEIFDLTDGNTDPDYVLRPATPPTSYEDDQQVVDIFWDPATAGDLLVTLGDDSVRRIAFDSTEPIDAAAVELATGGRNLAAVTSDAMYLIDYDDDGSSTVRGLDRATAAVSEVRNIDSWVTGIAMNRNGAALLTTWDFLLLLPSGPEVPIAGGINNLAW